MSIFLEFMKDEQARISVNEFEVDGQKYTADDDEDEYSIEDDDENQDEETTDTEGGEEENDEPPTDNDNPEPEDTGDEAPGEGDTTEDDEYTITDDDDDDQGEEQPPEDGEEGDNPPGEDDSTGDDEYSLDDDDEDGDNEGDSSDGEDDELEGSNTEDKLKELEAQIFDQLSPEQQQIRISELKNCYQELHERCDSLIKLLNDVDAPDDNTVKIFEYLNDNLTDLKQYIYDYYTKTFETKTYMENDAQYQKYIAILNSLNGVLEELVKTKKGEDEK